MNAKELENIKFLEQEIKMWNEYLQTLKKRSLEKVRTEKQATSVEETEEIINDLVSKLEKQKKEAIEFIAKIPYSYIRMGIVYKYEEGLTWREAAQRMGFMNEDSLRTAVRYLKEYG